MAKLAWKFVLGTLIAAGCGFVASAQDVGGDFIVLGSRTEAPKGFVEMCSKDATFCSKPTGVDLGDPKLVTGTLAERSVVAAGANTGFTPVKADRSWFKQPVTHPSVASWTASGVDQAILPHTADSRLAANGASGQRTGGEFASLRVTLRHWAGWSEEGATLTSLPSVSTEGLLASRDAAAVRDVPKANMLLRRINEYVNARVAQKTDQQVYGRDEVWQRSGVGRRAAGDCEDIAIEKRYQLVDAGFPADQLYFAVVYERQVGLHAVLVARIADGDYVLDSRTPYVKRWDQTNYTFVSIQSPSEPMQWHALSAESLHIAQQVDGSAPKTS